MGYEIQRCLQTKLFVLTVIPMVRSKEKGRKVGIENKRKRNGKGKINGKGRKGIGWKVGKKGSKGNRRERGVKSKERGKKG